MKPRTCPPPVNRFHTLRALALLAGVAIGVGTQASCGKEEATEAREQFAPHELRQEGVGPSTRSKPIAGKLRFVAYNVRNWLTTELHDGRHPTGETSKPQAAKSHVARILAAQSPDVVGLCEIGTRNDLREVQRLLKAAGANLPHLHHETGSDETRSLGLLSRHPIISTARADDLDYRMNHKTYGMSRGILDATIRTGNGEMRFVGVHLKSKREVDYADQELIRLNEARLLRNHVDTILAADPKAPLVVYGDFNDTYPSAAVRAITMHPRKGFRLKPVYLKDSRNEAWTHHWKHHDIYSRIDFVCVADSLASRVNYRASGIVDDPAWASASDHRALLLVFR